MRARRIDRTRILSAIEQERSAFVKAEPLTVARRTEPINALDATVAESLNHGRSRRTKEEEAAQLPPRQAVGHARRRPLEARGVGRRARSPRRRAIAAASRARGRRLRERPSAAGDRAARTVAARIVRGRVLGRAAPPPRISEDAGTRPARSSRNRASRRSFRNTARRTSGRRGRS